MQIAIISTALSLVLFLCLYLGFRTGLRLGMSVSKGTPPTPLRSPVQAVIETVEGVKAHKDNEEYDKELAEMMRYTGDLPKGE